MHPVLFYAALALLTPIYIPFLILFIFIPREQITSVLKSLSVLFYPLRVLLLTPGAIKSHLVSKTFWFRPKSGSDKTVLILGGNAMTPYEAYDGVYSYLRDANIVDCDCACIPLQSHFTQKEYIEYLVSQCKENILVDKKYLYLCGHSLGGALSIHLAKRLLDECPELEINLFLSRTFDKLWDVSKFRYGDIIGGYFEKIFSGLWELNSQKVFDSLDRKRIKVVVQETNPDEVLGPAQLKVTHPDDTFKKYDLPDGDSISPELIHSISQAHLKSLEKNGKFTPHG